MKQLVSLFLLISSCQSKLSSQMQPAGLFMQRPIAVTKQRCDLRAMIPHEKYRADVVRLEDKLEEIGLCSENETSCIKDLPT